MAAVFGHHVGDVSFLAAGAWSLAFSFRDSSRDYVIRLSAFDEDFTKDRRAARLSSAALPVPRVVDIGRIGDGFYVISERHFGDYLEDSDGARMHAQLPALMAAFDAMRTSDVSENVGYGVWGADGQAPHPSWREALLSVAIDHPGRRAHGWRERLGGSPTGTAPFDAAFEELRRLSGVIPESRHLIHGDMVNRNVLVAGDRITAVMDWGSAMYGDFLYDLAWMAFWAPWYPAWGWLDFRSEAGRHYASIGLEVPLFEERFRACQIHIGLDGQAYQARFERWSDLARTAQRTTELAMGTS